MNLWIVTARATWTTSDGWSTAMDYPTFFLDGNIQGITCEADAERVVTTLLTAPFPHTPPADFRLHITTSRMTYV